MLSHPSVITFDVNYRVYLVFLLYGSYWWWDLPPVHLISKHALVLDHLEPEIHSCFVLFRQKNIPANPPWTRQWNVLFVTMKNPLLSLAILRPLMHMQSSAIFTIKWDRFDSMGLFSCLNVVSRSTRWFYRSNPIVLREKPIERRAKSRRYSPFSLLVCGWSSYNYQ